MNCPVCGHDDQSCKGDQRDVISISGVVAVNGPMRVPKQRTRFGRAGYKGNVELYDPKYPKLRMVNEEPASASPAAGEDAGDAIEKPKRTRKPKE